MGLATDYCVKESVLAGLHQGFAMSVVPDGIRAVNVQPTDGEQALRVMHEAGATLL
jgi:nicotinamidase/pyrazinamidase